MEVKGQSLGQEAWERLKAHRSAMLSLVLLVIIVLACLFAPLITPIQPEKQAPWFNTQPPMSQRPMVDQNNEWVLGQLTQ